MCQGTTPWARWWRHDNVEKTHKLKGKGQPFNEEKMETEEVKSQEKMKTDKVEFCTMDKSSSLEKIKAWGQPHQEEVAKKQLQAVISTDQTSSY